MPPYSKELLAVNAVFRDLADRAGALILELYSNEVDVSAKGDGSPLTAADLAADAAILEGLSEALPDLPVVTEETILEDFTGASGRYILVDPLDGTKEFLKRTHEFTVNLALIEEGRPVAGVVFAPAMGRMWSGHEGGGAELRSGQPGQPLAGAAAVAIATRAPLASRPLVAVASRSHLDPDTKTFLEERGVTERASIGSSLKFCLVAQGEADLYPRLAPTMAWDTAAGHAVLNAAGGCVCGRDGAPLEYRRDRGGERPWLNPHFIAWSGEALKDRLMLAGAAA